MMDKARFEVELVDDVTPNAKRASSSLSRLQNSFQKFSNSTQGKALSKFAKVAGSVVQIAATAAAAVAGGVAAMTVGLADFGMKSKTAFGLLTGSASSGAEAFDRMRALAQDLGLDVQDTVLQAQKLMSVGFDRGATENLIKMGADMQALGASTEKVTSILDAMGKIQSTGTLQGDELQMLAEAGINIGSVYARLGAKFGKTTEQIIKMKEAGKIKAADALGAIGETILATVGKAEFGQAGKEAARSTLSGMLAMLKAGGVNAFINVAEKAAPAFTQAFSTIFQELDRFMSSADGAKFFDSIAAGLIAAADGVRAALPAVKAFISSFSESAVSTWQGFAEVAGDFMKAFGGGRGASAVEIMKQIGKALGVVAAVALGVAAAFGALAIAGVRLVSGMVVFLTGLWNTFVETFGRIIFGVTEWFANIGALFDASGMSFASKAFEIGKMIVTGIADGIAALGMLPLNLLIGYAKSWVAGVQNILGIHSPSRVFENLGAMTVEGFNVGMESMPTVQGMAAQIGSNAGLTPASSSRSTANNNVSLTLNVSAGPGATEKDAQTLGTSLRPIIRREVLSILDGAAMEAGA